MSCVLKQCETTRRRATPTTRRTKPLIAINPLPLRVLATVCDVMRRESITHPAGLEPAAYGLGNRCIPDVNDAPPDTCESEPNSVALSGPPNPQNDSGLAAVVASWPKLPEPVRAGILAMVRASCNDR